MTALDLLMAGRFEEAILAYQAQLAEDATARSSIAGLASALMGAGRYAEAIPWKLRVHSNNKQDMAYGPGQLLELSCAYWCLGTRLGGISAVRQLCEEILNGNINMAPDQAGGATFGLILNYMAVTARDERANLFSIEYLDALK